MRDKLIKIESIDDIPSAFRNTPIGRLLEYHNLNRPYDDYKNAEILVSMCMDNRKYLHIPYNFAYILRTGGGNIRSSEFKISYAIAVGGVKHIALIAHNNCGMVNLMRKKDDFIKGLVDNVGWTKDFAEEHFLQFAPMFEIGNEIDFASSEAKRLRVKYPNITIVPLFFDLEDDHLYFIDEN